MIKPSTDGYHECWNYRNHITSDVCCSCVSIQSFHANVNCSHTLSAVHARCSKSITLFKLASITRIRSWKHFQNKSKRIARKLKAKARAHHKIYGSIHLGWVMILPINTHLHPACTSRHAWIARLATSHHRASCWYRFLEFYVSRVLCRHEPNIFAQNSSQRTRQTGWHLVVSVRTISRCESLWSQY